MMHWLVWLLFGFRGRIPRKTYWLAHNRESGAYTLTDSGRATLTAILEDAEIGITPNP
jgi:uncharacterized membrane protein YhaH (DUF805 family)